MNNSTFRPAASMLVVATIGIGAIALVAGCEKSEGEKIEDATRDAGNAVGDAVRDGADAAADGLKKVDDKIGDMVED